jgi:hypothetical protein
MPPRAVYVAPGRGRQTTWYNNYKTKASVGLGIVQIVLGFLLIAANTAPFFTDMYIGWFYIGHGFWSGVMVGHRAVFIYLFIYCVVLVQVRKYRCSWLLSDVSHSGMPFQVKVEAHAIPYALDPGGIFVFHHLSSTPLDNVC